MTTAFALDRYSEHVDVLEQHEASSATDFAPYRAAGGILRFVADYFGWVTLYPKQVDVLLASQESRFVVVRGCHGAGKDFLLAIVALYDATVMGRLVLVTSASERQLLGQVWRELRGLFARSGLPGVLMSRQFELGGEPRIVAMTSSSTSNLTGWHDAGGVTVLMSEAQGEQVEASAYDAILANITDERSHAVVGGNPTRAVGRFFELHRTGSHWRQIRISAFDHPNIIEGRDVIPGGPTRQWIADVEAEYGGRASVYFRSRVEAEFPVDGGEEGLIQRAWIERAVAWHESAELFGAMEGKRVSMALDVARFGGDASVLAVAKGPAIRELIEWRGAAVTTSADRVIAHGEWLMQSDEGIARGFPVDYKPHCIVDAVGLGAGVVDVLQVKRWPVSEFNGAHHATEPRHELNCRASSHWHLRELLEAGRVALPRDAKLAEELLSLTWFLNPKNLVQIVAKEDLRADLGRSPDRADAVVMACWHAMPSAKRKSGSFRPVY